jgi:hypothetical protein
VGDFERSSSQRNRPACGRSDEEATRKDGDMGLEFLAETAANGEEALRELPIPPAAIGLLALAGFGLLLVITFAFRSVGNRH